MSLYIKGIDMPSGEGNKLVLQIFPTGEVYDGHGIRLGIREWSEAIQVPPHGRLGDMDEVDRKLFEEQCRTSYSDVYGIGISDGLSLAREEIETAQVIIRADEGEP